MTDRMAEVWPAAALQFRSGDLELRWMDDHLALAVADVAVRGIHDADYMPFNTPWTQGTPDEIRRSVLYWIWTMRGTANSPNPHLTLAVLINGEPAGIQSLVASEWRTLREISTGSWLGREFQGSGVGTRMRALSIRASFEGLGATQVTSGAFTDNAASNRVSSKLGYELDGIERGVFQGRARTTQRYRLTRERWEELRSHHDAVLGAPVELLGCAELLEQLEQAPESMG
ncbi:MAG TPA: GNAT family protein [Microbacteriaceae bacterium]|nr:GNAT family protein [Microbacteriaceae bacterium]